jgi:hypothetical protein
VIVFRASDTQFRADDTQLLKVKRLVSHYIPSLDYEVFPGPGFTVTVRDGELERLAPGTPRRIEEIIGTTVEVGAD